MVPGLVFTLLWCEIFTQTCVYVYGNQGPKTFEQKLNKLCLSWLGDKVCAIRESACVNLTKIAKVHTLFISVLCACVVC